MEDTRQIKKMRVLMFPWFAHGHITPFLELAKKLFLRNFHIYFCSSPVNLNSIKQKLFSDPKFSNHSIELVELHLPSLPSLPPHYHTTNGLPPHLMPTLDKAIDMAKPSFNKILETLKPDLVIRDFAPAWVPDLASSLKVPTIVFITSGAALVSFSLYCLKNKGGDDYHHHDHVFPFPEVYLENMKSQLVQNSEKSSIRAFQFNERSSNDNTILIKSSRELEGKYMDYISSSFGMKVVPVGPLVPYYVHDDEEGMDIINWLNKKEKSSTVFACFGSQFYLSKEDMEEIAYGLELSKVNFIWVLRFAKGEVMKLEDALPNGFLERVRDKGLIVADWAPQLKILKHSSIGGFVSHCGWNSLLESIKFGVPIIAMPMQFDQPLNARLVEECGIGLEVERDNNGRVGRENLAKVIRKVVVEKNGDGIRQKAKEMGENMEKKDDEELDGLVKELLQLCQKECM
ncbi:UDP-glucosyltransferase 29-like [Ziziphus jujuba]|uniref:Glycosyltransferase n=1 Tax=Ziziphus jujuba TaxID=326968 RepID=A0A6P3ZDR5_ZIZJJ|nr:UDP-glucosyltransferase 29-like [Ziziphus jujuba]